MSLVVLEGTVGERFWTGVCAYLRFFCKESGAIEVSQVLRPSVVGSACQCDEDIIGSEDWILDFRMHNAGPRILTREEFLQYRGQVGHLSTCPKEEDSGSRRARFVTKHGASSLVGVSKREWLKRPRELCTPLGGGLVALKGGESIAIVAAIDSDRLASKLRRIRLSLGEMSGGRCCR